MKSQSAPYSISESQRIDAILVRFEKAWQDGDEPSIDDHLPADVEQSERLTLLRELVAVDFEYRLAADEEIRVESYLTRFDELNHEAEAVLDLIAQEHDLRANASSRGAVDEYAVRFPTFCEQLPNRLTLGSARRRRIQLNCPHCENPVVVLARRDETAICPTCKGTFEVQAPSEIRWSPETLPKLDKFQLLEMVGRGAFGTVYRAKDTDLDRTVAVKIPRSGRFLSPEDGDRFAREARSVAQLSHPGIVGVYEVGRTDEFPYIVAEYVDGVTLDAVMRTRTFSFRETAVILANLADALQHAHDRGVVHRDLKPANIMLQPQAPREASESSGKWSRMTVPSVGRPRLMDFGLARRDGGEVTVTMEGQLLGTPAYMSPEQARGDTSQIDARSDVYGLGVILHQMLSGELPFRGTMRMLLHQVVHEEPPPPRKFNSQVPPELDTICLKCLEKASDKRYQSAGELADELRRYLDGEPILARPVSHIDRFWRWCRRHPTVTTLSASLVLALVLGVAGITMQWLRAESHAATAIRLAEQESEARDDAERKAATLAEVNRFFNDILGSGNPAELGRDVTIREALDNAAARIEDSFQNDPHIEAAIRQTLGETYRSLSAMDEAVFHLRRAVHLYQQVQGPESLETLDAINLLAGTLRSRKYMDEDDVAEAESLRRHILKIRRRIQGPHHPDTYAAMGNLGNVLSTAGREPEAIALFQQSLEGHLKLFGPDSPEVTTDRYNLAASLLEVGEAARAEVELRELLKQVTDPKHPDSLLIQNMLADVLHDRGNLEEAKAMYLRTLQLRDEVLGPLHLHTLSTFRRFTRLLVEMQEFETALPFINDLLERHDERIGHDAGLTLGVRESMALTLEGLHRFSEAEQFRIATYDIHKQRRDQKYAAETRQQLVAFYESREEQGKADALLQDD